jgi:hypothetical protein
MQASTRRPSPALVIAIVALIVSLTGTAFAAKVIKLPKNSVGSRQLKSKSVTTGKIANNAVTSAKVAAHTLTGQDINVAQLGTVPNATNATSAGNSNTLGGHSASCPSGTTLIRGICFDLALNPPVNGAKAAANACASKGGWLPTPYELYAVRTVINLGSGVAPDFAVADAYFLGGAGFAQKMVVIDGSGKLEQQEFEAPTKYICAYPLVR